MAQGSRLRLNVNTKWHRSHVLPRPATLDQRVRWHVAHARQCGCRAMPAGIVAELRRRGAAVPARRARATGESRARS